MSYRVANYCWCAGSVIGYVSSTYYPSSRRWRSRVPGRKVTLLLGTGVQSEEAGEHGQL
jgi:hypothetical protein